MNELTVNKTFEDKLKDRVKDSFGELLSDDDLRKLVNRSVEDIFFNERKNPHNTSYNAKKLPPLLNQIVKELCADKVSEYVKDYIKDNGDTVLSSVKPVLEQDFGKLMTATISNMFATTMQQMQYNIQNDIQNTMNVNNGY